MKITVSTQTLARFEHYLDGLELDEVLQLYYKCAARLNHAGNAPPSPDGQSSESVDFGLRDPESIPVGDRTAMVNLNHLYQIKVILNKPTFLHCYETEDGPTSYWKAYLNVALDARYSSKIVYLDSMGKGKTKAEASNRAAAHLLNGLSDHGIGLDGSLMHLGFV